VSGISSKTINKRLLVFANFFKVNGHHTQTGQVDLYVDRTTNNLLELEYHRCFTKLDRWITKTCHGKHSFVLSIHSDVRTKPG